MPRLPRLRRRKHRAGPELASYPGVRFRISVPSGVILDLDSEHLHYAAKYGAIPGDLCGPGCPPGCDRHGWLDLLAGAGADGATEFSTVPVKIEVKPVRLRPVDDPPADHDPEG